MGKGINFENDNGDLIPEDDYEYEKKLAEEEREKKRREDEQRAKLEAERLKREKQARQERDRRIAQDKIDLMKMKAGIATEEEEIKEVHEEVRELHGWEKVQNIWYHDKVWIILGTFLVAVVIFITVDTLTRVKPDLEILLICDNDLQYSPTKDLLEEEFAEFVPDLNDDGKVKVSIIACAMNEDKYNTMYQTNSQKFFANIQQGKIIMVLTDSKTDPDFQALMVDSLPEEFPDNPHVDEYGLALDFDYLPGKLSTDVVNVDNIDDVHLCLRRPINTLDDSLEEMQENYDKALELFKAITDGLTAKDSMLS